MFPFFFKSKQEPKEDAKQNNQENQSTIDWKILKKTIKETNLPSNQHTLVVFGYTGASKKQLVQFLLGKSFVFSQNKILLATEESDDFKTIQEAKLGNSKTTYNILTYGIDEPDYSENIFNVFAVNKILSQSEHVVPVLAINYNHFKADRGQALRKLFHFTSQVFQNNQDLLSSHLTVIITNAPDKITMDSIRNQLIELLDSKSKSNSEEFEMVGNAIVDFIDSWPESVAFLRLLKPRERPALLSQLQKAQGNAEICKFQILDEIKAEIQLRDERKNKFRQWEEEENLKKLIKNALFLQELVRFVNLPEIYQNLLHSTTKVLKNRKKRLLEQLEDAIKQPDVQTELFEGINEFDKQLEALAPLLSGFQEEFQKEALHFVAQIDKIHETEENSSLFLIYKKFLAFEKISFVATQKNSEIYLSKIIKTIENLKEKATKTNSSEFKNQIRAFFLLQQILHEETEIPEEIKAAEILSDCKKTIKQNENVYFVELMKDLEIIKSETQFAEIKEKLSFFREVSENPEILKEFQLLPQGENIKNKLKDLVAQLLEEIDNDLINLSSKVKIKQISMLLSLDDEIEKPSHSLNLKFYSIVSKKVQICQKKIKKQFKEKKYAKVEVNMKKMLSLKEEMKRNSSSVDHALKSVYQTFESFINLQNRQILQLLRQEKYEEIIPVHQELVEMRQIFDNSIDEKIQAAESFLNAQILEKLSSMQATVQKGRLNERIVHSLQLLCQVLGLSDNYQESLSFCLNYLNKKHTEVIAASRMPFYEKGFVENLKKQLDAAEMNEQTIFPQFTKEKLRQHVFHELGFQIRSLTRQMSDAIINDDLKEAEKCFSFILEANKITFFVLETAPLVDAAEKILLEFKKELQDSMSQHLSNFSFLKAFELINNFGPTPFRSLKVNLLHAFSNLNRAIEDEIYQYHVVVRENGYLHINTVDYIAIKKKRDNFVAGMELFIKYNASLCAVKVSAENAWKLLKDKIEKEVNNNIKRLEDYNFIDFESIQEELLIICKAFSLNHKLVSKCKEIFEKYEKPFDRLDGRTVHSINALFQGLSNAAKSGTLGYPQKHKKFLDYFDTVVAAQCQKISNLEALESLTPRLDESLKNICLFHINQNKNKIS